MTRTSPNPAPRGRHRGGAVVASGVLAAALAAPGLPAAATGSPAAAVPGVADVPPPAAHYAFDDTAPAAVVPDLSGNGRDATLVNVATATVTDGAQAGSRAS